MSTSGYLVEYDVAAFQRHVEPLAGKSAEAIVAALEAHPDAPHWDDETRELLEEADDVNELLRRAFAAWCVTENATVVPLGRSVTLREFAREVESLDPSGGLRDALAPWVRPAEGSWRVDDEFELNPARRLLLDGLWARAAALGLTPLDETETEALERSGGGDARVTLSWVGRVLQTPGRAVAYFYESLPAPQKKVPPPDPNLLVVLKDLLLQEGLTPWDYVHEGAEELTWRITAEGQAVGHATVKLKDGQQRWWTWKRPGFLHRLFGNREPALDALGMGACPDPACSVCKAATRAATFLKRK